jgi:hypothetical protein
LQAAQRQTNFNTASNSNESKWKIPVIVLTVIVVLVGFFSLLAIAPWQNNTNSTASIINSTSTSTAITDQNKRRSIAVDLGKEMSTKFPGVKTETSGSLNQVLLVTSSLMTNEYCDSYRTKNIYFLNKYKEAGFTEVILDNTKKKWNITL